jgi:hypothetical protein
MLRLFLREKRSMRQRSCYRSSSTRSIRGFRGRRRLARSRGGGAFGDHPAILVSTLLLSLALICVETTGIVGDR